jgi:hypothetical protein
MCSAPNADFFSDLALSQGIVAARMERMALQQPFDAENAALEKSVTFKRQDKIRGTGGVKPARGRKQG